MTHPIYKPGDLVHARRYSGRFRGDMLWDAWGLLEPYQNIPGWQMRALYRLSEKRYAKIGGERYFSVRLSDIIPHRKVPPEVQAALMRHHLT